MNIHKCVHVWMCMCGWERERPTDRHGNGDHEPNLAPGNDLAVTTQSASMSIAKDQDSIQPLE